MVIKKKKKVKKNVPKGLAFITSSFNNTVVTITDTEGNVLATTSSEHVGFKGTKKSTPFATQQATEKASIKAIECGMKILDVLVKGAGAGRETAVRAIQSAGIDINSIKDITPIPHNGCRPRKRRRV